MVELTQSLGSAAKSAGFRVDRFGEIEGVPLLALTRAPAQPGPRIYISAGIHGDEPAPTLALLRLLGGCAFDDRVEWYLCPLLNPAGLARGTRENAAGIDLNRDYRHPRSEEVRAHVSWLLGQPLFDLALLIHEDWESKGFYLYELNPNGLPSLAEPIVAAVAALCPIDRSPVIDGREAAGGIIRPPADPSIREIWPESIYLRAKGARLGYTLETPSSLPLESRIAAHCVAIGTAVGLTARERSPRGP